MALFGTLVLVEFGTLSHGIVWDAVFWYILGRLVVVWSEILLW